MRNIRIAALGAVMGALVASGALAQDWQPA